MSLRQKYIILNQPIFNNTYSIYSIYTRLKIRKSKLEKYVDVKLSLLKVYLLLIILHCIIK